MWQCSVCQAKVEDDSWEVCWRCSSARKPAVPQAEVAMAVAPTAPPSCQRCGNPLEYGDPKKLPPGIRRWVAWLDGGEEMLARCEPIETGFCPRCRQQESDRWQCPICGGRRLIRGEIEGERSVLPVFRLEDRQFRFTLCTPDYVRVEARSLVCLDCGLLLARTNTEAARECVQKFGSDPLRQAMNLPADD